MPSPEERLLTLLESAQTTIGEAVELIAIGSPYLKRKYQDEGRTLVHLIRQLQNIGDDISAAAEGRRESAEEGRESA